MVCAYVQVLGKLGIGKAFGELAILYNCKRTASVRALTNGEVWMIDRDVFQQVRKKSLKIAHVLQLLLNLWLQLKDMLQLIITPHILGKVQGQIKEVCQLIEPCLLIGTREYYCL